MKKNTQSPSVFGKLLKEARASMAMNNFEKGARKWLRTIVIVGAVQFIIALGYALYMGDALAVSSWVATIFVGSVASLVLSVFVGIIPLHKNWKYSWRLLYIFHRIYGLFLLGVFVAMIDFFLWTNFGEGLWPEIPW